MTNSLITKNIGSIFDHLDVSETTRAEYKTRVGLFLRFLDEHGLNPNSFLDFKRELTNRTDYSVSTKNKYLATAKIFLKEANRQGLLPVDITQNIKAFKGSKKHKREGLTEEEIQTLTEKLQRLPDTDRSTRLRAIVSLLLFQGLRQVEITRLDVKDLDFPARLAYIQGKGKDDKEAIHLHPSTVKALQTYLKVNRISDGALFVSQSNNSANQRLTTRAIRDIVGSTLDTLGIEKTTHGFRHYFTTKLIQTYKGDLLEVARYTRHASLEMLQVYNDNIKAKADLPRFYGAFEGVTL